MMPNRKAGTLTWRAEIRTPGLPPNTRRLGDLRLECEVGMAARLISNTRPGLFGWIDKLFPEGPDYCHRAEPRYLFFADRPLFSVTMVAGARREIPAGRPPLRRREPQSRVEARPRLLRLRSPDRPRLLHAPRRPKLAGQHPGAVRVHGRGPVTRSLVLALAMGLFVTGCALLQPPPPAEPPPPGPGEILSARAASDALAIGKSLPRAASAEARQVGKAFDERARTALRAIGNTREDPHPAIGQPVYGPR